MGTDRTSDDSWERHLVVRVGRLGDIVMVTPAIQALLERERLRLVLLTSPVGADLLRDFDPRLGECRVLERRGWKRPFWSRRTREWVRGQSFDAVWLFESAPRYGRLFDGLECPVHAIEPEQAAVTHFSERCLRLIRPPADPHPWADVPVPSSAVAEVEQMLAVAGIPDDMRLIGLHPGFSGLKKALRRGTRQAPHPKLWPIASWAALARRLVDWGRRQARGVRVVMALAPEEVELGRRIESLSEGAALVLPPPSDLGHYRALLARYDLLIAPDTGPGHLAAAVGTPVVSLFSVKDPAECAPYAPPARLRVLRAEEAPRPELGLAALTPEFVAESAIALWGRSQ